MTYYWRYKEADIKELEGKTLTAINGAKVESERVEFVTSDGKTLLMVHCQDCCESVEINEIVGDIKDLIGTPIITAYETSQDDSGMDEDGWERSATWTFYHLRTIKGDVMFRWYGSSNGYYSESANCFWDEEE